MKLHVHPLCNWNIKREHIARAVPQRVRGPKRKVGGMECQDSDPASRGVLY